MGTIIDTARRAASEEVARERTGAYVTLAVIIALVLTDKRKR